MNFNTVYERDLLYSTENLSEPGSIHLSILNSEKRLGMPVVIEAKTVHNPIKYISTIVKVIQNEVFDRIGIDMSRSINLFILASEEYMKQYGGKRFIAVEYNDGVFNFKGVESPEI